MSSSSEKRKATDHAPLIDDDDARSNDSTESSKRPRVRDGPQTEELSGADSSFSILFNDEYKSKEARCLLRQQFSTATPFAHLQLDDFVMNEFLEEVKNELLEIEYVPKCNDLYDFEQSKEGMGACEKPHIKLLRQMLYGKEFREWLQEITGIPQLSSQVDMSSAVYSKGSYLACHDDNVEGRVVAFIVYLVPADWSDTDGGSLALYAPQQSGVPSHITRKITPRWNSFSFFNVSVDSFHEVMEVLSADKTRVSFSGWYYGEPFPRPQIPSPPPQPFRLQFPTTMSPQRPADHFIQPQYLSDDIMAQIHSNFAEESSVRLQDFLPAQSLKLLEEDMRKQEWGIRGPANKQFYLQCDQPAQSVKQLADFFESPVFMKYLAKITGCVVKRSRRLIRRFNAGHYTLAHDEDDSIQRCGLDMYYSIMGNMGLETDSSSEDRDAKGGFVVYMDEESELLTLPLSHNCLEIVFRDTGCMSFVKVRSSNITLLQRLSEAFAPDQIRFDFLVQYEVEEIEEEVTEESEL